MSIIHVKDEFQTIGLKGVTRVVSKDALGNVLTENTEPNNILLTIRKPIIKLLGGVMTSPAALPFINAIGFGTDDTPPTVNQTGLLAPVDNSRRVIAAAPVLSNDGLRVTFTVLFDLTEPDIDGIALKEACLYTVDGVAVARTVIGSHTKIAGTYMEFYWEIGYI